METTPQVKLQLSDTAIELREAFTLNEKTLQLRTIGIPVNEDDFRFKPTERKFKSKMQLEEIVLKNGKLLFGEHSLLLNTKVSTGMEFPGRRYYPDAILFDFTEEGKPKCYLIETMLAKEDFFGYLFPLMTGFFAERSDKEMQAYFSEHVCAIVSKNYHFRKKLQSMIADEDVIEFVKRMLATRPPVVLITDSALEQLPELMHVYSDTWGKLVKPMVLRKFSVHKEFFCSLSPDFADIDKGKVTEKVKVIKSTEHDHFINASDAVRDSYLVIKTGLWKADETVEFNPKQYYISIRKGRNLAFAHIGRKRISLVVVNPEKETRKVIKHHVVKTLTEKVQKFWNGESCTIIIENTDHIEEVITLLNKLVAKL